MSVAVSIVIVCMNRMDNLRPCLESIRAQVSVSHEILVVAYRFSKENLEEAKRTFPEVVFIESNDIRGFSENNNLALRKAKGEFCFVLNDDTELHSDVIGSLVEDFSHLPKSAAILCPKLLNGDGSLQLCGRPPYPARNYALQQWHLWKEPKDDTVGKTPVFGEVFETSNISGAAFLIKTEVFKALGWFDEKYFFTPEDIALSTLARKKGYGVYVDRAVSVIHKWRTTASAMSVAIRPASVRGSLLFFGGGSVCRYFCLALPVFLAESAKFLKASVRCLFFPTRENKIKRDTFRSVCGAVWSRKTPKELFKTNYQKI